MENQKLIVCTKKKAAVKSSSFLFDISFSLVSTIHIYLGEKNKLLLQKMLFKGAVLGGELDLVFTYLSHTFQLHSEFHGLCRYLKNRNKNLKLKLPKELWQ